MQMPERKRCRFSFLHQFPSGLYGKGYALGISLSGKYALLVADHAGGSLLGGKICEGPDVLADYKVQLVNTLLKRRIISIWYSSVNITGGSE